MKKLLLILLCLPMIGFGQYSNSYKEFNGGLYLGGDDLPVFPGISFLVGRTNYYDNIVIDYEIGFALPTVFTGKAGVGFGDQNNASIIGVRPWPTTAFIQHVWSEKKLISIEVMIPHDGNFISGNNIPLIINYGYRW